MLGLAVGVAVALGFPSTWVEWTAFDSIAISRITLLDDGNVSIPSDLLQQVKQGQIWRLITTSFIHVGVAHLLVNAALIYYLTAPVEGEVGSWRVLGLFLLISAVSNLVQSFYSEFPFVGLSGFWCGMLGYRAMWQWRFAGHRLAVRPWIIWIGLFVLGITVIAGVEPIASLRPSWFPRMSNASHVSGLLVGFGMGAISICLYNRHIVVSSSD